MDFNNTSGIGIIQLCEIQTGLGLGRISGNSTLLQEFTGLVNLSYKEVWKELRSVARYTKIDDYNWTNFHDAPIALVASQPDYELPVSESGANLATLLAVTGLYFSQNGTRIYLTKMTDTDIRSDLDGTPTKYMTDGKSLIFDCPVSSSAVTLYTNVHVEFERVPSEFTTSDTTKQPGFLATHHHLIPVRASYWYLSGIPEKAALADRRLSDFLTGIELAKRDIATMDTGNPRRLTPNVENCE